MCLIALSIDGRPIPRKVFEVSGDTNSDGIGVMSEDGIRKFMPDQYEAAWEYLVELGTRRIPHAVHWRWMTHGEIALDNVHPFRAEGSNAYIMHNGIITATAAYSTKEKSDTRVFIEWFMDGAPGRGDKEYYDCIGSLIGSGNKFVVFHQDTCDFTIVNETEGYWKHGIWYSNMYSLPQSMGGTGDIIYTSKGGIHDVSDWDWRAQGPYRLPHYYTAGTFDYAKEIEDEAAEEAQAEAEEYEVWLDQNPGILDQYGDSMAYAMFLDDVAGPDEDMDEDDGSYIPERLRRRGSM